MLAGVIYSMFTFYAEWWSTCDLTVYGESGILEKLQRDRAFITFNHCSGIDFIIGWLISERTGIIGGTRTFMKNESKYFPVVGPCWYFAEYAFLRRNWKHDEPIIGKMIDACCNTEIPLNVVLFCEGTRKTDEKLKASQEYARANNMEPLKHHLLPRTKGYSYIMHRLKDQDFGYYDIEMFFPDEKNATTKTILQRGKVEAHILIRKLNITPEITESIESATKYCYELYREKDALIDFFINNKRFPAEVVELKRGKKNLYLFLVENILSGLLAIALNIYCVNLFGIVFVVTFNAIVFASVLLFIQIVIGYTQSKSSKSGVESTNKKHS